MGMIGTFIDRACARRPDVMRRVYARTFGTLADWISIDDDGNACGCLIGSIALADGVDAQRDSVVITRVARILGMDFWNVERVGIAVVGCAAQIAVRNWKAEGYVGEYSIHRDAAELRLIDLMKRRIAKRLGLAAGATCAHCGTTIPGAPVRARSADGLTLAYCSDAHREADDRHMQYMLGGRQRTAEYLNLDDGPAPSVAHAARRAAWGEL